MRTASGSRKVNVCGQAPPGARAAACAAACPPATQCQKQTRVGSLEATSNRPEENPGRAYLIAPSSQPDRLGAGESRQGSPVCGFLKDAVFVPCCFPYLVA
jgi:hypothetical protein